MYKSSYWIKLYHEILVDPKMGTLDDRTWRRAIELFLIAGEHTQGGALPPIEMIAWKLHAEQDEILSVMPALEKTSITSRDESGIWRVTNFAKRQGPSSSTERMRAYRRNERDEDRDGECDDNRDIAGETDHDISVAQRRNENALNTDTESESETDSESETESDTYPETDPVSDELTSGQNYYFRAFKSQPNRSDVLTLAQLENAHGYYRLTQVIDWAIKSGIPPGRAPRAIRTAITGWCDQPPPRSADHGQRTGALEKLRRELCGGFDT